MSTDVAHSIQHVLDHVVDFVPGVVGALVASADGFTLASRLPPGFGGDTAALGAMTAASLGLSSRLVQTVGAEPASVSHHRSHDAQVFVVAVADVAAVMLLADGDADAGQVAQVGHEAADGLLRLFRDAATAPARRHAW